MARVYLDLVYETLPAWAEVALSDMDRFLQEHANMERKASAMAMSFVNRYPERTEIVDRLIDIAVEELEHFQDVYRLMVVRNVPLRRDEPDAYATGLLAECRHGREDRFIDRMCVASIIETRGAERFRLISQAMQDEVLRVFYRDLWASEARHGNVFVEMLLEYFPESKIYPRLQQLIQHEAQVLAALPWRPSLH